MAAGTSSSPALGRSKTPPPSIDRFLQDGLRRYKPASQIPRERQSEVFKRAVAELNEDRSPGRAAVRHVPTIAIPVPERSAVTTRSISPGLVSTTASTAARGSVTARHKPPTVEPMRAAAARSFDVVKHSACQHETYYTGGTLQEQVAHNGNSGALMRSSTPRQWQVPAKTQHAAESQARIVGIAKEQLRRPNSGVGFAMSSPRIGFPTCRPAHSDYKAPQRVIVRSMKFNHVQRPAIWTADVAEKRLEDRARTLLATLRLREVNRVVDEWFATEHDAMDVVSRLVELGYTDAEAARLATDLRRGVSLVTLAAVDRRRVEAFRVKLGEACLDRLRLLEPLALENVLEGHAFGPGDRARLRAALHHSHMHTSTVSSAVLSEEGFE
jgi:hypothetical protein